MANSDPNSEEMVNVTFSIMAAAQSFMISQPHRRLRTLGVEYNMVAGTGSAGASECPIAVAAATTRGLEIVLRLPVSCPTLA